MTSGVSSISLSSNQRSGISQIQREVFCTACKLVVKNLKEFKVHFASDFHRYNSKRRMLGLEPNSQEEFIQKKKSRESEHSSYSNKKGFSCKVCKWQLQNHLASKRHKTQVKAQESRVEHKLQKLSDASEQQIQTNDGQIITTVSNPRVCLFCNKASAGVKKNLDHMKSMHSFWLLEPQAIKSIKRLLIFIAQKIQIAHSCLLCSKFFKTSQGTQDHMIEKGHCFMNVDNFQIDYQDFYDFSRSYIGQGCLVDVLKELRAIQRGYPDDQGEVLQIQQDNHLTEKPKSFSQQFEVKSSFKASDFTVISSNPLKDQASNSLSSFQIVDIASQSKNTTLSKDGLISFEKIDQQDKKFDVGKNQADEEDDEQQWEDIDLEDANENSQSVKISSHQAQLLKQSELEVDSDKTSSIRSGPVGFDSHPVDMDKIPQILSTGEIKLSNGKIIGHRMFKHIYKQNIKPNQHRQSVLVNKLALQYRNLNTSIQKSLANGSFPSLSGVKIDKDGGIKQKDYISRLQKKALKLGSYHHKLQHTFRKQTP